MITVDAKMISALNAAQGFATNGTFTDTQAEIYVRRLENEGYVLVSKDQIRALIRLAETIIPPIMSAVKVTLRDVGMVE